MNSFKKEMIAWSSASVLVIGIVFLISGAVGALCFPYAINSWLVFAGKAPIVLWWHGFLLGCVPWVGQTSIPVAAITFIAMLFLV